MKNVTNRLKNFMHSPNWHVGGYKRKISKMPIKALEKLATKVMQRNSNANTQITACWYAIGHSLLQYCSLIPHIIDHTFFSFAFLL